MVKSNMAYKGPFRPKNPQKYKGDPTKIIYRSLWELRMMRYFDSTDAVLEWSSEEVIIPYRSPKDRKLHRYFPDFVVKLKEANGNINILMIEVKPLVQTKEPINNSKHPRRYLKEVMTYGINLAKWKAAQEFCADRGWQFKIFTEKEIGV
jgi:hypothetical protein